MKKCENREEFFFIRTIYPFIPILYFLKFFNISCKILQNIHYICTNQKDEHVMPKTKNSDVRIKVIDRCLSDRTRNYSTEMIFDLCNEELEKRDFPPVTAMNSIRADIEQIQRIYPGADVETVRVGRNIYYRYEDPDFSIFKTKLKPDEVIQLTQTLRLLQRFKGMPQFNWINEISDRLGASLKIDETTEEIVGFDENLDLEGMDNFTPLFNAIVDKRTLKLTYKSFKHQNESTIIVHPYYLKQFNKRWFLIAWDDEKQYMANYAFDRILAIDDATKPYRPCDVDFVDYFDDMIGVSKDTRTTPQLVKLWVSPESAPYIKTKPFHGTQKIESSAETGTVITINVYLNYELEQQILYFGENIKVLAPLELQERIKQRLSAAINNYGKYMCSMNEPMGCIFAVEKQL